MAAVDAELELPLTKRDYEVWVWATGSSESMECVTGAWEFGRAPAPAAKARTVRNRTNARPLPSASHPSGISRVPVPGPRHPSIAQSDIRPQDSCLREHRAKLALHRP